MRKLLNMYSYVRGLCYCQCILLCDVTNVSEHQAVIMMPDSGDPHAIATQQVPQNVQYALAVTTPSCRKPYLGDGSQSVFAYYN